MNVRTYITPIPGTTFATNMESAIEKAQASGHAYFVVRGLKVSRDASGYYVEEILIADLPTGTFRIEGAKIVRITTKDVISANAPRDGFYRHQGATAHVNTERTTAFSGTHDTQTTLTVNARTAHGITKLYNLVRSGALSPETAYVSEPVDS
jgi:hypothetical protein